MKIKKIKEMLNNDKVDFNTFYTALRDTETGYWDGVNNSEIITQYVSEQLMIGVKVSHIVKAIEQNTSSEDLYCIWLGNSMNTPTPINTKLNLIEALEIEL